METALRRIADMLEAVLDAVGAWAATGAWRPENWPGITWGLVAAFVVLSWLLAWRRRAPRTLDVRPPQLLVTSGEVVPDGIEDRGARRGGRRRRPVAPDGPAAAGAYVMTVSNLSRYPVQLLELALRDGRRGAPRVATVDEVVPAMGSVSVSGRIPLGLRGDGLLDLYCYAAAPRVKVHRHRVELVWEPWAARFKAAPLEQASTPTRRLASDERDARFLEDDAPVGGEPVAVAVALPASAAERREAATPDAERRASVVDRSTAPPPPHPSPAIERGERAPTAPAPKPRPSAGVRAVATPAAPPEAAPPAGAPPEARRPEAARPEAAPPEDGSSAGARTEAFPEAPRPTVRPASAGEEARAVPRIGTPPVGVAVAGRGGAAARTADGLPIGRPRVRAERPSDAPSETPRGPTEAPRAPVAAEAPEPAVERAPEPAVEPAPEPVRRTRRLEFPDEF